MDLKRLVAQLAYRIERKPEGGFIARATDPSVPPLEASTREELQKKIQEKIFADLSAEFPGLKLPPDGTGQQFAFHIERTPNGGFSIHSADPNVDVVHTTTEKEFESRILEKILGIAGKALMPELAQSISAQVGSGEIKVVVNKSSFKLQPGSHELTLGLTKTFQSTGAGGSNATDTPAPDPSFTNPAFSKMSGSIDNSPITPESSNFGRFLRLLPAVLLIAVLIYFLLLHHR
jgi:hypothetical protein